MNHVLDDLEIFTGKVSAALNGPPGQDKKNKKKGLMKMKKKKEKSNENGNPSFHFIFLGNMLLQ